MRELSRSKGCHGNWGNRIPSSPSQIFDIWSVACATGHKVYRSTSCPLLTRLRGSSAANITVCWWKTHICTRRSKEQLSQIAGVRDNWHNVCRQINFKTLLVLRVWSKMFCPFDFYVFYVFLLNFRSLLSNNNHTDSTVASSHPVRLSLSPLLYDLPLQPSIWRSLCRTVEWWKLHVLTAVIDWIMCFAGRYTVCVHSSRVRGDTEAECG